MIRIPLIFALLLLALPACGHTAANVGHQTLYEGDSIYNHITIRQFGSERCMIFGRHRDLRQTCMDMTNRDESAFEYTAMMFAGHLFNADARSVCLIGLGGGYIPTVFRMHLPQVRLHTVELDPLVYKLAKDYFSYETPRNHALTLADGRQFLKRSTQRYDQIWLDAYNSDYVPAHMMTKEFLELTRSRLNKGGWVIQNLHCGNYLYDAQVVTFRAVFPHVFVFMGGGSNCVIVAGSDPVPMETLQKRAQRLKGRIGRIELAPEIEKLETNPAVRKAPILTDDYNPANLMLHKK